MRLRENPSLLAGIIITVIILSLTVLGFFYTPYDYNEMNTQERFAAPGLSHLMGTDNYGRDVFTRVVIGSRYTLLVDALTVSGALICGCLLGLSAGYFGGIVNEGIMRLMDALSSFPGILLSLVMVAILRGGKYTIVVALFILFIPFFSRILRSGVLSARSANYVKIARLQGASHMRILFRHIFPNLRGTLLAATTIGLSNAILSEASLSYLGLGIQPPLPSWGRMLSESQNFLLTAPWASLAPGLMIVLTVVGFHFLSEGLEKHFSEASSRLRRACLPYRI